VTSKPLIFVTDGSYPNGLAAVRALGRAGFRVTVGERSNISATSTVAFWSRHCAERFRYPDPAVQPEATAAALSEHFRNRDYDAAIPVGLTMTEVFVRHGDCLSVQTMLPPENSFDIAVDKRLTFKFAAEVGIPVPRTVSAERWHELKPPLVLKHQRTGAIIARSQADAAVQAGLLGPRIHEYIAQEYIPGENGFGYFGFFQNGEEARYFMHERLMQFPKQGGPSVVARAIHNKRLREFGRRLLQSLNWHGVAMVEFKRSDYDGEFYLIEINPKFWGSLDLAIQAGCNFPAYIAQALTGRGMPTDAAAGGAYGELTYQWVIPNGLKCFLRYPEFRGSFLRNLAAPGVRTDLRWLDPLPAAAGLFTMALHMVNK
jgi:predicted ATP-grasp superfamily ATP-dependent carboligase